MKEKINTFLLLVIATSLVVIALKPHPKVRRFQPITGMEMGLALDTETGQVCRTIRPPAGAGSERMPLGMPLCVDLAAK